MKLAKYFLGLLFVGTFFASCDKPLDPMDPVDVTKNGFLNGRIWKVVSHTHTLDNDAANPVYSDSLAAMPDCRKDDYIDIRTTSSGFINNYFIKCLDIEPEEYPIFYSVTENDTYIKFFTDPDNIDGTTYLQGEIKTPTIDRFVVTYYIWNTATEKTEKGIVTFDRFYPEF